MLKRKLPLKKWRSQKMMRELEKKEMLDVEAAVLLLLAMAIKA